MSVIFEYADTFGIDRQEVVAWVNAYIRSPDQFPRLVALGLIESTEAERKESIQKYLTECVANSIAKRIKSEIFEERAAIMEFDGGMNRIEAEKLAAADVGMTV